MRRTTMFTAVLGAALVVSGCSTESEAERGEPFKGFTGTSIDPFTVEVDVDGDVVVVEQDGLVAPGDPDCRAADVADAGESVAAALGYVTVTPQEPATVENGTPTVRGEVMDAGKTTWAEALLQSGWFLPAEDDASTWPEGFQESLEAAASGKVGLFGSPECTLATPFLTVRRALDDAVLEAKSTPASARTSVHSSTVADLSAAISDAEGVRDRIDSSPDHPWVRAHRLVERDPTDQLDAELTEAETLLSTARKNLAAARAAG